MPTQLSLLSMIRLHFAYVILLLTVSFAQANKQFSLTVNRLNRHGQKFDHLTCQDFGIQDHDCHLSFNVCVGDVNVNKMNSCELVDADYILPDGVTSFPVGNIINIKNQNANEIPDNVGIRVKISNLRQNRKLLFVLESKFESQPLVMGTMHTNGTILQLEYVFRQHCTKNYFGDDCDVYCTQTHSYKCDNKGRPVCTLTCNSDEKCQWDINEEQFHCQCDPSKGCSDIQKYHQICKPDFCHFGHKSCFRKSKVCLCEMEKLKPSYCHYVDELRTFSPNKDVTASSTTVAPIPTEQTSNLTVGTIVTFAILFFILAFTLAIIFGIKMARYRRAAKKFQYGPMRSTYNKNAANENDDDFNIPPSANIEYNPNRLPMFTKPLDQEDSCHSEHNDYDKDPIIMS